MTDTFRSKVIKLAYANPGLRPHLLPLLREAKTLGPYQKLTSTKVNLYIQSISRALQYWDLKLLKEEGIITEKDALNTQEEILTDHPVPSTVIDGSWEKITTKNVTVRIGSGTNATFSAILYEPTATLPRPLDRVSKVVVLTRKSGDLNMQDWWGNSGAFSDAVKKEFGFGNRQTNIFDGRDFGAPIGIPHDSIKDGIPVLVYT